MNSTRAAAARTQAVFPLSVNGTSAATNAVIFSAGIDHENHGLYGTISAS